MAATAATRLARLPRLTLFSGPSCSLCDTAKAELAKVKQNHLFELETVNIQDIGQERWKKKYIYWIPALHLDGEEIAKEHSDPGGIASLPFFADSSPYSSWEPERIYVRASETTLGDEIEETSDSTALVSGTLCFNCGEPNHVVSACPYPINRQLVALSRQLHDHLKAERGVVDFRRIHEVETWRSQRLDWLDAFQPGEIHNPLLQEALGDMHDGYLANMALWGYPKGWFSVEDPKEKVKLLIWDEFCDEEDDTPIPFQIYGDQDKVETIPLDAEQSKDNVSKVDSSLSATSSSPQPVRWATYPASHFSSERLPIYNGVTLPPITSNNGSTTYTMERHALWQQIVSSADVLQPAASVTQSLSFSEPPPPPPTTSPPPLPPVPAEPEEPSSSYDKASYGEVDMDISDSD